MARKGEIWLVNTMKGSREMLILAEHGDTLTGLMLAENEHENSIEVVSTCLMYADPYKVSYMFEKNLDRYIKKANEETFAEVLCRVADGLGLSREATAEPVEKVVEKIVEVPKPDIETKMQLLKTEGERDTYKGMYEALLKMLTEKA